MARTWKLLILLALLALAILLYVGIAGQAADGGADNEGGGELTALVSFKTEDAEAFSWSYYGEEGRESYTLKKRKGTWMWTEESSLELDQEAVESLLQSVANLGAESVFTLDENADLSDYGMNDPACSVTVEFAEDSGDDPVTILIGDYNSMAYGYYVMIEGGTQIGLTDSTVADLFSRSPKTLEYVEEESDADSDSGSDSESGAE